MTNTNMNLPVMIRGYSMLEAPQMLASKSSSSSEFLAVLRKVKKLTGEKIQEEKLYSKYGIVGGGLIRPDFR